MKKTILFMSAVAMLAAVSCNKAEIDNSSTEVETPSVNNLVEFVAYTDVETKTSLNGLATEWEGGDMIDINGITFETSDVGSKATFTADEKPEVPYHAGYPCSLVYDNEEQVEGKLGFNFDNSFVLDAGTLCDDVLAVAYSESEPSLQFKNVVSLLKFRVPEFIEDIKEIRISTTETLAGDIYVNYNDATWTIDEDRESFNEIVITPGSNKFEHGEDIYYYVPVLPGKKTNLTVRINGYIAATGKTIEFKRNFIHNLGTLPAPVVAEDAVVRINNMNGWGDLKITIKQGATSLASAKAMTNEGNNIFSYKLEPKYVGTEVTYYLEHSWYQTSTKTVTLAADSDAKAITLNTTYLQPNAKWNSDNPRFGAHIWETGKNGIWVMANKVKNNFFEVEVPTTANYSNIIWCRMDPNNSNNDWGSVWNQTLDLTLKHLCYCLNGNDDDWNKNKLNDTRWY